MSRPLFPRFLGPLIAVGTLFTATPGQALDPLAATGFSRVCPRHGESAAVSDLILDQTRTDRVWKGQIEFHPSARCPTVRIHGHVDDSQDPHPAASHVLLVHDLAVTLERRLERAGLPYAFRRSHSEFSDGLRRFSIRLERVQPPGPCTGTSPDCDPVVHPPRPLPEVTPSGMP